MKIKSRYHTLRLVLGDQLNASHSWYREKNESVLYVLAELKQETNYVKHHCQKICAFFAAMNEFYQALLHMKHHVLYMNLDETAEYQDLPALLLHLAKRYKIENIEYQRPDEYRLREQLTGMKESISISIKEVDTEHFFLPFEEIMDHFTANKHHKMEFFYRKMRSRFNILMDDDKPEGGQWNYDSENRNKLKKNDLQEIPQPLTFSNNVKEILKRLERHNIEMIGERNEQLLWPTSRQQALTLLKHFCRDCLPKFGLFQDAMTCESEYQWSLYHSRLSFALNSKMLHPSKVIHTAIDAYRSSKGQINLAQIEGFVRQILGWREYVRGVYWANMPEYQHKNHYQAKLNLPNYFWTGQTKMSCMKHAITQSLDYAYAHHIQRLMITGNFCLLTGIDPDEVDQWYLGIYIDAIEWVELPNTRGMSQFADGGIVATKPYSAGGNYINKMSDYCKSCHYNVNHKNEEDACPFNSLYWHFMDKQREALKNNPRIGMVYRNWDKQSDTSRQKTLERANWCLNNIEKL